ncbi:hypothetical protein B0T19DRAFT_354221 [Cercophora scortea]|uniref:AAA+ ATPase domain-containing protein n=1 Tax=Cercophora scortea TaxID=314031 RepID=A0AAE0MGZ4_9PEZI|nr:hypothetical protein B0T19DRAFT_354221 [Cercophora scortea]
MYSRLKDDGGKPTMQADSEPPDPAEIDILTFGVSSEAILAFFSKLLGVEAGGSQLIRFGKPFRPLIRNLPRVREHLGKLENSYGVPVAADIGGMGDPQPAGAGTLEAADSDVQGETDSDVLPFASAENNSDDDDVQPFDRPTALPHFQAFLAFIDKYLGKEIHLYERLREGKESHIAFENLWMLFDANETIYCPYREAGTDVYNNIEGRDHTPIRRHTPQAYRVVATSGGMPLARTMAPSSKRKEREDSTIGPVSFGGSLLGAGTKAIAEILTQTATISRKIRNNYTELNLPVVVDVKLAFEGGREADKALIEVPEMRSLTSLWLPDSAGEAFDLFGKSSCPRKWCYSRGCTANVYIGSQKLQRDKIENDIKLGLEEYEGEKQRGKEGEDRFKKIMEEKEIVRLLPGAVPGFALRNRKWVLLDLNRLGPINKQGNGWDDLVLPPGHRDMVQAMVETHTQDLGSNKDATVGMDLVQGKGRGCIILLHGVPGVGKTSTAECVAAHTKKPLYPITCGNWVRTGDIGYRPEDVERNMESHFKLAHKWGCVLLLDEADVFLAKRDQKDVQRNGLVSVFLRILEYYSGILFLTTNRVGAIDDAFRSRLHLTLYYPKLTRKQTKEIFKKNFGRMAEINDERIEKKLLPFEYKDSETKVLDWVKQNWKTLAWNGRQIRNTFQTALSLAEFQAKQDGAESQGPVVRKKHFMIVANASAQFNEYLRATHGYDEEVVASRELTRAVQYTPSPNLAFKGFDDTDTSSDEEAEEDTDDDSSDSDSDSDDSDKETKKKKNKSKGKKEKDDSKSSPKKNKKMSSNKKEKSDKKEKAEKKEKVQDKKPSKEKKKGNKGTGDNNSDDSE